LVLKEHNVVKEEEIPPFFSSFTFLTITLCNRH
jgi:hypothetical protein